MTKERIAICISGQVRTSDERLRLISEAAKEVDADVYISVWKARGGKSFDSGHKLYNLYRIFGPTAAICIPKNWCEGFEDVFPNWKKLLPLTPPVTRKGLLDVFPNATIDIENDVIDFDLATEKNSIRMLYRIWRCNGMKRKYEKKMGFRYDRVIRLRPDILLDFKALMTVPYDEGNLQLKLRRGGALHDTYWAGSSDVDDKMAELFGHALVRAGTNWSSIHHEIADHAKANNITPVDVRCVKTDFAEFGNYTDDERYEIVDRFRTMLSEPRPKGRFSGGEKLNAILPEVVKNMCTLFLESVQEDIDPNLLVTALSMKDNEADAKELWLVLPPLSLVYSLDSQLPDNVRGYLAYNVLLDDALSWATFQGLRSKNLLDLLPGNGCELLPLLYLDDPQSLTLEGCDSVAPLVRLWQERMACFKHSNILKAHHQIIRFVIGDGDIRTKIFTKLRDTHRFEELLKFAQLYHSEFPERKNASVLVLHAKKAMEINCNLDG